MRQQHTGGRANTSHYAEKHARLISCAFKFRLAAGHRRCLDVLAQVKLLVFFLSFSLPLTRVPRVHGVTSRSKWGTQLKLSGIHGGCYTAVSPRYKSLETLYVLLVYDREHSFQSVQSGFAPLHPPSHHRQLTFRSLSARATHK